MKNDFDSINEALDVEASSISKEIIPKIKKESSKIQKGDAIDIDSEYTRGILYSLVEKGNEAIDSMLEIAQNTEKARDFEVAGQLIKNVSEVTDKLIDLQQKMKKIKEEDSKGPKNVTNALFVGSTAELQKLLKQGLIDNK
jgi:lipopolysaccharide biosynthesis regulator YciM